MTKAEIIKILNNFVGCDNCPAYQACHGLDGSVRDKTKCKKWVALQSAILAVQQHKGKIILKCDKK
jgi:hypothetical protein